MLPKIVLFPALAQSILVSAVPKNAARVAAAAASATPSVTLPPPGPIVNVTSSDPINGTASIMTSLLDYAGCSDNQKNAINQAFIDALNIVGTVGGSFGPSYIFTGNPISDPDNLVNPPWDYFGSPSRTDANTKTQIIDNFLRAQAPSTQWRIGDWWNGRYFTITCNDPGDNKGNNCNSLGGATGYEVEPKNRADGGQYPLINFCSPFWEMDSLATRVDNLDKGYFDENDVRSLYCQGTAFLHEMMHTSATSAGVSVPRCQDVEILGYPGKAYGPARAKQLARIELGGPEATSINVDNYVFYAATWYMYQKYEVVPKEPKYAWPRLGLDEYYPEDNATVADDFNSTASVSGTILDDQDFYAGTNYTPPGGDQPAGPTGLASTTELIAMLVTASPQNVPCSTLPPFSQSTVGGGGGGVAQQPAMCGCNDGSTFTMTNLAGC